MVQPQLPAEKALQQWLMTPEARRLLDRKSALGLADRIRSAYLAGYRRATEQETR